LSCVSRAQESGQHVLPRAQVTLLAPITRPGKVICVGMNYADHCREQNVDIPQEPIIFSKFPSAINGPFDEIIYPAESNEVDWEVELAFVIGKKGKHIKTVCLLPYHKGILSPREVSSAGFRLLLSGTGPACGLREWSVQGIPHHPVVFQSWLCFSDPHKLGIRCKVNGELVQNSNTSHMIFKTPVLVAWISRFRPLSPGDVVLTGTPPGVGFSRKSPVFLKRGDVVQCEIDELGAIQNKLV
uniref:Fumarylacetoacetate hydrolase domain containing 2A n=1 Tax=Pelodiscus sinensis TaxID=13735 RepID=K7FPB1_PELSI